MRKYCFSNQIGLNWIKTPIEYKLSIPVPTDQHNIVINIWKWSLSTKPAFQSHLEKKIQYLSCFLQIYFMKILFIQEKLNHFSDLSWGQFSVLFVHSLAMAQLHIQSCYILMYQIGFHISQELRLIIFYAQLFILLLYLELKFWLYW